MKAIGGGGSGGGGQPQTGNNARRISKSLTFFFCAACSQLRSENVRLTPSHSLSLRLSLCISLTYCLTLAAAAFARVAALSDIFCRFEYLQRVERRLALGGVGVRLFCVHVAVAILHRYMFISQDNKN